MFKPDKPITSAKEDLLGRGSFAQSLGDAILTHQGKDSLVIGLFGAWGTGKTSIINMALEHIADDSKDANHQPIIIKFNPWNYSDQNQLIAQFFAQLSVSLSKPDYAPAVKQAGDKLLTYASYFEPIASFLASLSSGTPIGPVLKFLLGLGKLLSKRKEEDLNVVRAEINR